MECLAECKMLSEAMEAWCSVCMNVLKGPDKYFLKIVLSAIKADGTSAYQGRSVHNQRGSGKLVITSTCQTELCHLEERTELQRFA